MSNFQLIYAIAIVLIMAIGFVYLIILKPSKQYFCHEIGCYAAFDSFGDLLGHLQEVHNYTNEMLLDLSEEYIIVGRHK